MRLQPELGATVESAGQGERLTQSIQELSDADRNLLREVTDLTPKEAETLTEATNILPAALRKLVLMLIGQWDNMTEGERIAALLAIRHALVLGESAV
jgi:hypothetical protein